MTDDKTVVSMVKGGNTDAYSLLVEKYQTALYRIALAILHEPHEAEDILQDAFIQGYLKIDSLRSPEHYYPWMVQILKKRCFNALSRTKRTESEEIHAEYIESLSDDTPTPESILIIGEGEGGIERAVSALPDHLRETARLFFLHGIKQKQISAHLGVPIGTVKRRIHDAKIRLRKELDTMKDTNTSKLTDNFTTRVAEKIAELENYNKIHGSAVGFDAAYRDTLNLIGELSDKGEAAVMAARATKTAYRADSEKYVDEALECGIKNNDPLLLADAYLTKWGDFRNNYEEKLAYIENTVLPTLTSLPDTAEKFAAIGRLLFWAYYSAMRIEDIERAEKYLKQAKELLLGHAHLLKNEEEGGNVFQYYYTNPRAYYLSMAACAEAGEIDMEKRKNCRFREETHSTSITSHGWRKENGNLRLEFQPGFHLSKGNNGRYTDEIFYYAACSGDGWFFPHTDAVGETEVVRNKYDQFDTVQSIVSKTETVMTPAGVFENCLHIRKTNDRDTYDIWYADRVGIVRYDSTDSGTTASFLLTRHEIKGGEGYMPLAVGNHWQYTNISTPEGIEGTAEYTVVRNDEDFVYLTSNTESGILNDAPSDAPDILLMEADRFVEDDNCDRNDYDSYRRIMEQIIMANKSRESVEIALNAADYLKERKGYADGYYRFLPSSCNMSTISRAKGKVTYNECAVHSISTGRWGTRGDAENRIFGAKPFRYPDIIAGCIWNDDWVIGYTEAKKMPWDEMEYTLTVGDGGSVTTKAGTFSDCRKVTITCEAKEKEGHYYFFQYTHCGVKEYWYAPGVGIVYHRCKWGPCESECELTDYNTVSGDGEYMPVYIGNRWCYEEKNLTREGYIARRDYGIVSGMNDTFLMRDNQMFVYLGTEAEYEAWKEDGCPVKE
ncbi:MAG: sigma-70 family RNA polymerase sigma factor [Ruminococcaceae bacterium]|nr:sigma-70 family RNA polymerase sigma factor [Oscillospiraceae bacterium]